MLLSLVYFAVRRLPGLLTRGRADDDLAREIEMLVLRHQLRVLARGRRMPLRRRDRVLLAVTNSMNRSGSVNRRFESRKGAFRDSSNPAQSSSWRQG